MHDSVTVHMAAPPQRIWELVSDVTKIGKYSPETFEAEWLDGATGPAVGAKFRGHVKRNRQVPDLLDDVHGARERSGPRVRFRRRAGSDKPLNIWRYRLEPSGDGTDVTESFELANTPPLRLYWALFGWARGRTNRNGMRTTLEAVKAEVESSSARWGASRVA